MPLDKLTKVAILGSAGYLYLRSQDAPIDPTEPGPAPQPGCAAATNSSATPTSARDAVRRGYAQVVAQKTGSVVTGCSPDPKYVDPTPFQSYGEWGYPQEVVDAAIAALSKKWEELTGPAKREACERLKQQFPDDPAMMQLDCGSANFQKVLVAATAALAATCLPCSVIAIVTIALFGDKIEQFLSDAWNQLSGGAFEAHDPEARLRICVGLARDGHYGMLDRSQFTDEEFKRYCDEVFYGAIGVKV